MRYNVVATIQLTFDSEDGLVTSPEGAMEEMYEYLSTGPSWQEFDLDVIEEEVD